MHVHAFVSVVKAKACYRSRLAAGLVFYNRPPGNRSRLLFHPPALRQNFCWLQVPLCEVIFY